MYRVHNDLEISQYRSRNRRPCDYHDTPRSDDIVHTNV